MDASLSRSERSDATDDSLYDIMSVATETDRVANVAPGIEPRPYQSCTENTRQPASFQDEEQVPSGPTIGDVAGMIANILSSAPPNAAG
jgi:hypothetical protein